MVCCWKNEALIDTVIETVLHLPGFFDIVYETNAWIKLKNDAKFVISKLFCGKIFES